MHHRKTSHRRRKAIISAGIALSLLFGASAAYAAWALEASGSATSTETTGAAGSAPVTVTAGNLADALTPGGPAGALTITVNSPNQNAVTMSNFVVAVTGTSAGAACAASNFTVTQPVFTFQGTPEPLPYTFAANASQTLMAGTAGNMANSTPATIALNGNAPAGCESVTVNISETAS